MSSDPKDVVIGFCEAFEQLNVERVLGYLAPDVVYRNVPIPAMHGVDEAADFLIPILTKAIKIEFKILSLAVSASGDQVLTERLDRLHFPSGVVDTPLMGIFTVRDGKILEWRDYSDCSAAAQAFADAKVDMTAPD